MSACRRPPAERAIRWLLKEGLTSPLFAPALKAGRMLRPLAAAGAQEQSPLERASQAAARGTDRAHDRKVLLLGGCVQPSMRPEINAATVRVLDAAGIQTMSAAGEGCCGALRTHLGDHEGGLTDMRRNIDAWWPLVERRLRRGDRRQRVGLQPDDQGVWLCACGTTPSTRDKAARIVSALARDLCELLAGHRDRAQGPRARARVRVSPFTRRAPCSMGRSCAASRRSSPRSASTSRCRPRVTCAAAPPEPTRCCIPSSRPQLRDSKLGHLLPLGAECIVSANIGCIQHLQSGTATARAALGRGARRGAGLGVWAVEKQGASCCQRMAKNSASRQILGRSVALIAQNSRTLCLLTSTAQTLVSLPLRNTGRLPRRARAGLQVGARRIVRGCQSGQIG